MTRVAILALFLIIGSSAAYAHEQYHEWKIPGTETSCCNDQDCKPVRARANIDGLWQVWHEGRWLDVQPQSILPIPSPDGRSHACIIGSTVLCMVPGEVRS
jgi:hypothetical protein